MSTPPPIGMSAPPPPPPPPPPASRKGCFIAIGVVIVLLMLVCLGACIFAAKSPGRLMAMGINMGRTAFVSSIAADVPADQKAAFEAEFTAYVDWLNAATPETFQASGQAAAAPMQYLQGAVQDKSITSDEIQRFIEMTRQLRGVPMPEPPAPEPMPEPATAPEGDPTLGSAPDGATFGGTPIEGTAPDGASAPVPQQP
jgi:hypothetical protein